VFVLFSDFYLGFFKNMFKMSKIAGHNKPRMSLDQLSELMTLG
jgi:hypothetical protein